MQHCCEMYSTWNTCGPTEQTSTPTSCRCWSSWRSSSRSCSIISRYTHATLVISDVSFYWLMCRRFIFYIQLWWTWMSRHCWAFQWFLNLLVWSSWISFGIILVGVATHLYHVLITLVYLITFKIWLQEKWLACVNLPSSLWGLLWVPLYEWALWNNKSFSWYYLL